MGRSIQLLEVTGHCARTSALEAESIIGRQIARPAITTRFPARLKETQCLINAETGQVDLSSVYVILGAESNWPAGYDYF